MQRGLEEDLRPDAGDTAPFLGEDGRDGREVGVGGRAGGEDDREDGEVGGEVAVECREEEGGDAERLF